MEESKYNHLRVSELLFISKPQLPSLFAVSIARMKPILSNQTVDIPENVDITLKEHSYCEVPQRHPEKGDFNHINAELSLLEKKKRRLWVDK